MPVFAELLGLRPGSAGGARGLQGELAGDPAHPAVSSLPSRRHRPGSPGRGRAQARFRGAGFDTGRSQVDANKRLILAVAISFIVLLIFQLLFPSAAPPPQREIEEAQQVEVPGGNGGGEVEPARPVEPERRATLETEALRLVFSSRGAGIETAELLGPKGRRQGKDAGQVDLAGGLLPEDPRLFELSTGGGLPSMGRSHPCRLVDSTEEEVRFRCSAGELVVDKIFRLTGERTLRLTATARNVG